MKKRVLSVFVIFTMLLAVMPIMPASAAASIAIGEYLEMGTYYGEPILWRCVDIDENGPLILSDKIICLKPFDAAGDNTSGSHGRADGNGSYRKQWGSNYWADSNMRSWLNSNASAGNVTWLCGNPPDNAHVFEGYNDYANEQGFKRNFASGELGAIKTVTQDSLLHYMEYSDMSPYGSTYHYYSSNIYDVVQNAKTTAYREQVTDDFFLLDANQINAVYNNRGVLGDDYYIGEPTAQAVSNSEYTTSSLRAGNKWYFWLRSPYANYVNGTLVRYVDSDGVVDISYAWVGNFGVRPAFYLNLTSSSFISGDGTASAPYRVSGTGGSDTPTPTPTAEPAPVVGPIAAVDRDSNPVTDIENVPMNLWAIKIPFGCTLDPATANKDTITFVSEHGDKIDYRAKIEKNSYFIYLDEEGVLTEGTQYQITVPGTVANTAGVELGDDKVIKFKTAGTASPIASGTCGTNANWTLYSDGELVISGTGAMTNWSSSSSVPWYSNWSMIKKVVINNGITSIGDWAFYECFNLISISIPNSVTSIGNYALYYCRRLSSINIPNSVMSIGNEAFSHCDDLNSINVLDSNSSYSSVDGVLFNKNKTALICYPGGKSGEYTISNSVTSIGEYAFYYCRGLTSINIPNSVTSIGNYAFRGCSGLTNISIPNSVTSIGRLFEYCSSLTNISIPNSVTSIDGSAFYGCDSLLDVYYGGTQSQWNTITIYSYNEPLTNASIHYAKSDYAVTYNYSQNGGTSVYPKSSDTVVEGSNADLTITATKSGWTFVGWNTNANATTALSSYTVTGNVTLYAIYKKTLTAEFYSRNNQLQMSQNLYMYNNDAETDFTFPTPTAYSGWTAVGWRSDTSAGNSQYASNASGEISQTTKFYALYSRTLTLSYNANGGSTTPSNQTATQYYNAYGNKQSKSFTLAPAISKSGYNFDKWAQDSAAGTKYSAGSSITISDNTTMYATWTPIPVQTVSTPVISVSNIIGGKQATISCSTSGATIYYTTDGSTPTTSSSVYSSAVSFKTAGTRTIKAIAVKSGYTNSAVASQSVTVSKASEPTASLPSGTITSATKVTLSCSTSGAVIYYTLDGNTPTTSSTRYTGEINISSTTTLKAVAVAPGYANSNVVTYTYTYSDTNRNFTWNRDNWNFNNSSYQGYFSSGQMIDQISQPYLSVLADRLTNTEYYWIFNEDDGWLYDYWRGSCYGMSSLAFLAFNDLLPYSDYKAGADNLYQLSYPKIDTKVSSLITYYQLLQVKDVIQYQYRTVPNRTNEANISKIISMLNEHETVLLGFQKSGWGGHAILAYGYEYGSYTFNGVTYQGHIKICDPNSSISYNRNYDIYFNTSSYRWIIPAYSSIDSATGAKFNYIGADINEINDGGYLSGSVNHTSSDFVARIDIAAASNNRSIAKVYESNGNYITKNNVSDDIIEEDSFVVGGEKTGMKGYNLLDTESAYRISQSDPVNLDLVIDYGNCRLQASSCAGESIVFDKKGFVEVDGQAADYEISMVFNENYATDWFSIRVSGSNADNVSMELCQDGYLLKGDSLDNINVKMGNRSDHVSASFSTTYPSAYIYEIDEDSIGVSVDTDGNGTYETVIVDASNQDTTDLPLVIEDITSGFSSHQQHLHGSITATIENRTENKKTASVFLGIYDIDGNLKLCKIKNYDFNAGNNEVTFNDLFLENAANKGYYAKCFIWNDMKPEASRIQSNIE